MHCPSCQHETLKPTKLEEGLVAMGCNACKGAALSLLHYRDWVERNRLQGIQVAATSASPLTEDSQGALNCPKCGAIMTKYRIDGEHGNRLDLCAACDEAWLDGGEWSLLKSLALTHALPRVFTQTWQNRVQQNLREHARHERRVQQLGEADLQKADEIRAWLREHPKREALLAYIGEK